MWFFYFYEDSESCKTLYLKTYMYRIKAITRSESTRFLWNNTNKVPLYLQIMPEAPIFVSWTSWISVLDGKMVTWPKISTIERILRHCHIPDATSFLNMGKIPTYVIHTFFPFAANNHLIAREWYLKPEKALWKDYHSIFTSLM